MLEGKPCRAVVRNHSPPRWHIATAVLPRQRKEVGAGADALVELAGERLVANEEAIGQARRPACVVGSVRVVVGAELIVRELHVGDDRGEDRVLEKLCTHVRADTLERDAGFGESVVELLGALGPSIVLERRLDLVIAHDDAELVCVQFVLHSSHQQLERLCRQVPVFGRSRFREGSIVCLVACAHFGKELLVARRR